MHGRLDTSWLISLLLSRQFSCPSPTFPTQLPEFPQVTGCHFGMNHLASPVFLLAKWKVAFNRLFELKKKKMLLPCCNFGDYGLSLIRPWSTEGCSPIGCDYMVSCHLNSCSNCGFKMNLPGYTSLFPYYCGEKKTERIKEGFILTMVQRIQIIMEIGAAHGHNCCRVWWLITERAQLGVQWGHGS